MFDQILKTPLKPEKYFFRATLFIDALFTETATSFLVHDFGNICLLSKTVTAKSVFKKYIFKKFGCIQRFDSWKYCTLTMHFSELQRRQIFL